MRSNACFLVVVTILLLSSCSKEEEGEDTFLSLTLGNTIHDFDEKDIKLLETMPLPVYKDKKDTIKFYSYVKKQHIGDIKLSFYLLFKNDTLVRFKSFFYSSSPKNNPVINYIAEKYSNPTDSLYIKKSEIDSCKAIRWNRKNYSINYQEESKYSNEHGEKEMSVCVEKNNYLKD